MFSNLSSSSISLATVTPSLVVRGAPKLFSSTTLRPLGPSVTLTALARMSTPRSMRSRASTENLTSLAAMIGKLLKLERVASRDCGRSEVPAARRSPRVLPSRPYGEVRLLLEHPHDVALLHDQQLLAVDLDLGAGPLAEQHLVLRLQVEGHDLAGLVASAGADGDDLALLGLLGCGIGDDDAAGRLGLAVDAADDHAIMQRTKLHGTKVLLITRAYRFDSPMGGGGMEVC